MTLSPSFFASSVVVSCTFFISSCALADDQAKSPSTIIGAGLWSRPAYIGSDEQVLKVIPALRYYGTPWFARTTQGVLEGGVKADVVGGWGVGAQIVYEGGRETKDSNFLQSHHVANLPVSASAGVHAEWDSTIGIAPVNVLLRYRQEVKSERGAQTDLRGTIGVYDGHKLKLALFAETTWANIKSNQTYYGITKAQAVSTGLKAFAATDGFANNAIGMLWSYDLDAHWLLHGSLAQKQLTSQLKLSPLVQTGHNFFGSVDVAYRF
jgi:outer membrane protein